MTASLLHELRDPIFALRAHLQLMRMRGEHAGLDVLQGPIDDIEALLDFYGGLGRQPGQDLPVDLVAEVRSAAPVLRTQASRRRVALDIDLPSTALFVRARPISVRQVLMNLVNNALDAVAGQTQAQVWIRASLLDGPRVALSVSDNGPGWPAQVAERDRLVQPWVTTKGDKGSGLGLYLTRSLLVEAAGDLTLDGIDGQGARAIASWPQLQSPG